MQATGLYLTLSQKNEFLTFAKIIANDANKVLDSKSNMN